MDGGGVKDRLPEKPMVSAATLMRNKSHMAGWRILEG
jgi:hypothetical protein